MCSSSSSSPVTTAACSPVEKVVSNPFSDCDQVPRKTAGKRNGYHHIYMYFSKHDLSLLSIGSVATVASALIPSISSILMGRVFDTLSKFIRGDYNTYHEFVHHMTLSSMAIIALGAASIPTIWITIFVWMQIGENQGLTARYKLLNSYLEKPISWYDINEKTIGDLTQINRCVEELRAGTAEASALTLQNCVSILALLGTSFYYSWSVTLIMLASAPIIIVLSFIFAKLTERFTLQENTETTKSSKILDWSLNSSKLVRLFQTQTLEFEKFSIAVNHCKSAFTKLSLITSLNMGILRFIMLCMFVQGFWFGSSQVRKGKITAGHVLTCFSSCLILGETVKNTLPQILTLQKAKVALIKIQNFLNDKEFDIQDEKSKQLKNLSLCNGEISFKNINFSYPSRPNIPILKNVSLNFPAGQITFLVGRSGSGKSTLGNLLLKLYDLNSGSIEVDGENISSISNDWLTRNITIVEQSCTLFNDTLKNNILLGKVDSTISDDQLNRACQLALLNEVIRDLDEGLDTLIGNNGVTLSGGQQQRVALARAFIRDTPILILDESVSALDIVLRELIIQAIKKWRIGKTTIILTHEFNQIASDDFVYLMEDGRIQQFGKRKDLEDQGLFKHLMSLQESTVKNLKVEKLQIQSIESTETITKDLRKSQTLVQPFNPLNHFEMDSHDVREFSFDEKKIDPDHALERNYMGNSKGRGDVDFGIDLEKNVSDEDNKSRSKRSDLTPISIILKKLYLSTENKLILIFGLIFSTLNGAVNPIFSFCFSKLLTGIVPQNSDVGSPHYLLKWSLVVIFLALFDGVSTFSKEFLLKLASELWICSLRKESFKSISKQDLSWFNDPHHQPAEVNALLMNDSRDLRSLVSEFLSIISTIIILSSLGLIWALVSGWKLSLVCISLIPLFIITTGAYANLLQKFENEYKNAIANFENQVYEIVSGIKTIKTLNLQKHFIGKIDEKVETLRKVYLQRSIMTGLGIAITNMLTYIVQGLLLYYGMKLVGKGEYTTQQLMETFVLLVFSIMSCGQLISQTPDISRGQRAATYIFKILDLEPSYCEVIGNNEVPNHELNDKSVLSFKKVSFSYPSQPDQQVLKDVTFGIKEGEHVAVIGDSGSGKSTLTLLTTRLYGIFDGEITYKGSNINEINVNSLRNDISIVDQKATFFDGTILENLAYGLNNVEITKILNCLQMTNILEFVESLPNGINTRISTSLMSGGQAQRLSIARALVHEPQLLILDECTSALDAENTKIISDLILKMKIEKPKLTVLIVTHAEEMMKITDRVLCMKKGEIVENGEFNELFSAKGELFRIVTAGISESD